MTKLHTYIFTELQTHVLTKLAKTNPKGHFTTNKHKSHNSYSVVDVVGVK